MKHIIVSQCGSHAPIMKLTSYYSLNTLFFSKEYFFDLDQFLYSTLQCCLHYILRMICFIMHGMENYTKVFPEEAVHKLRNARAGES